ncbi:MAG TPA: DUF883 family protein [Pseudomonadales bacterium]|nr:DUF883 family protein [Pseudomonadales bacterium]
MTEHSALEKNTESAPQDALQVELQALIDDAEKLLQHATSLAGEHADELRQRIQLNLQRARETLGHGEEAIREHADELQRASATYIKNNPLQALGIAAGVGLLIGLLLGQRHHDK